MKLLQTFLCVKNRSTIIYRNVYLFDSLNKKNPRNNFYSFLEKKTTFRNRKRSLSKTKLIQQFLGNKLKFKMHFSRNLEIFSLTFFCFLTRFKWSKVRHEARTEL